MLNHIRSEKGFTLIEMIIVVTIVSILSIIVIPKLTRAIGEDKESIAVLSGIISKTFDDAFLKDHINYLVIHLHSPGPLGEKKDEIQSRTNGVSVILREGDKYVDNKRNILKYKKFPDYFKIEEVVLTTGDKITDGNVIIPFYPQGFSDNFIIHIADGDRKSSIRMFKYLKEPKIYSDYIEFDK